MDNEIYKFVVINGHVNLKYKVSNFGNIINVEKGNKLLKQTRTIGGYNICGIGRRVYNVHRLVLIAFEGLHPTKKYCDHINNIGTDNRLCNLRWATATENGINKKFKEGKNYKGVFYNSKYNNYIAKLNYKGKNYNLGTYLNIQDAKIAYNNKALELFSEDELKFAKLNEI